MNVLKYLTNKNECPLCKGNLKQDKYDVYCSHCGLVVFDYTPPSAKEIDFIMNLLSHKLMQEMEVREKFPRKKYKIRLRMCFNNEKY